MSDNITQTMSFDASSAISSLNGLNTSLSTMSARLQSLANDLRSFNAAGNQSSQMLGRLATNALKASEVLASLGASAASGVSGIKLEESAFLSLVAALNASTAAVTGLTGKIGTALDAAAADTKKNTDKMTTSLKLLSRIVFTQAIVRALSALRNTLRDVGAEAVEFQKKIALIRTIDDSGKSFENLSNDVRRVSDQFNIPLLETAAGLYQTISNQVGDATQSLQFLTEAAKFAKATDSSLSDSVDLLSGAMKSFGLGVDDTGRIASVFFKTIDLGRITADQLSNSFGRVGPQTAATGASLEEVGAAIAAISIKGSSSNESLTQFRGILTALAKPTVALKQAINDLGFTSTESAVKTLGLGGVLQALNERAGGSVQAFAKFFPNVRALNGAISLTADDIKTLTNNLQEMQSVSNNFIDNKFLEATSTDAQKVTSDINKLKNALTVELGQAFLKAGVAASEFIGGVDGLVTLIRVAPAAVGGFAASLISLAAAAKIASAAGTSLSLSFAGILAIPAAFGAGKSLGEFLNGKILENDFKDLQELIKADNEAMDKLRDAAKETLDAAAAADEARIASARNAAIEITKEFTQATDSAIADNKRLVAGLKSDANDVVGAYGKLSTAIKQAIADAAQSKQKSVSIVQGLQDEQAKSQLQAQIAGLNDAQKVYALSQKSAQLAAEAAHLIATSSGNNAQTDRGRQLAASAKQLADQEASIAKQSNNRSLQAKAGADQAGVFSKQIEAEQQLEKADDARVGKLEKQATIVDKIGQSLKNQLGILIENSGALDKQGNKFSATEQAQRQAARDAATVAISKLSLSSASTKQLSDLGLTNVVAKLNSDLTKKPIKLVFDADAGTKAIQDRMTQSFANFKVKLNVETGLDTSKLESLLGKQFSNPDQILKGADTAAKQAAAIRKQLSDAELAQTQAANVRGQINELENHANQNTPGTNLLTPGNSPVAKLLPQLQEVAAGLEGVAGKANITADDIKNAEKSVTDFINETQKTFSGSFNFAAVNNDLAGIVIKLQELAQAQKASLDPSEAAALKAQLQQIESVIGGIGSNSVGQQLKDGSAALQSAVPAATTIAQEAAAVRASYEAGARALIQAAQAKPAGGAQAQGLAHGGLVRYYADGGFTPRGTDTIPAMLSPGEFVINAASTRKFYSQLVAINAGRPPIYRSEGGPSTQNFNFGDMNFVSESQRNTARDFANGVRRELRRRTSTL